MIGDIYVWRADNNQPFTIVQRVVTGMPYRHNSLEVGDIYQTGQPWQLEAYLCVTTTPIEAKDCRIFRPMAPAAVVRSVAVNLARRYSGRDYGFLSLLNYPGRRVIELFGGDGRKFCPIRFGDVCSALIYADLQELAVAATPFVPEWTQMTAKLNEWHRNCYHAGDTITVAGALPHLLPEVLL